MSIKLNTSNDMMLSIVIVNYKSWRHLKKCLNSLAIIDSNELEFEVIVVDNDTDSEERNYFQVKFPEVSFIGNTANNGFANACNFGAKKAKGDYLLFLNPDTVANEEALLKMLNVAVLNPNYGIVSCLQVNEKGLREKQIRFFPQLKTLFGLFRALHKSINKKKLQKKYNSDKKMFFPDWVSGSVVLISRKWFDTVGGWNEDYWMYFEDIDLCKRVSENGGVIALLRDVSIIHNHGGASRINVQTTALTRSQVLISKHIYINIFFRGVSKWLIQLLLLIYIFISSTIKAGLGVFLFFIPKMYLSFVVYKNIMSYYRFCLKHGVWLSVRSAKHPLRRGLNQDVVSVIKIGYDAKRAYHNYTGLGNYSRGLISILAKYKTENNYFLYNPKKKKIDRLEKLTNIIEVLPSTRFWKKYSFVWRQGPIVKQLCNDGVHIFHGLSGEIPRGLESTNIKSVVTIHDLIFMRYPKMYKFMDRKIHLKKFLYAAKHADIVIAISEQTKKDIIEFLYVDPSKIKVVYQGCHTYFKTVLSSDFKKSVQDKFSLPEKFILNVGTIEERKNLLTLVKSIKDLDVNLIVVGGKTTYFNEVSHYIREHNLSYKVHFLEGVALKELAAVYQMASLFVYPSLFEGFGIPIIEALYSKIPVITSKGGCFSEAGGPNSIYIDPLDAEDLKESIQNVLSDEGLKGKMILNGFEYVQKFNDEAIAENMMFLYENLL
jgi:GT2 family glycosyltransferase